MLRYLTVGQLEALEHGQFFRDKTIFLRVDTNTTLANGEIKVNPRIDHSAHVIQRLAITHGAKVIVGTHNGRPGDVSYIGTGVLLKSLRARVSNIHYIGNTFAGDTLNDDAVKEIIRMKGGTAFLLENLRFLPGEAKSLPAKEHAKSPFIRDLIEKCRVDLFVLDAFSIAHRSHRSVVGFCEIPNIAGPNLHDELVAISNLKKYFLNSKNPSSIFVLGGKKIQDYFGLIERATQEGLVKKILTGGLLANLCLFAKGFDLGSETKRLLERQDQKGKSVWDYLPRIERLIRDHPDVFVVPIDVAGRNGSGRSNHKIDQVPKGFCVYDIGDETIVLYEDVIQSMMNELPEEQKLMVYIKGPLGAYDISIDFNRGSRRILEFVIGSHLKKRIFSVMGGGDTTAMLNKFDISETEIDYISLAGGALIETLAGETLPGIAALEESFFRFGSKFESDQAEIPAIGAKVQ